DRSKRRASRRRGRDRLYHPQLSGAVGEFRSHADCQKQRAQPALSHPARQHAEDLEQLVAFAPEKTSRDHFARWWVARAFCSLRPIRREDAHGTAACGSPFWTSPGSARVSHVGDRVLAIADFSAKTVS